MCITRRLGGREMDVMLHMRSAHFTDDVIGLVFSFLLLFSCGGWAEDSGIGRRGVLGGGGQGLGTGGVFRGRGRGRSKGRGRGRSSGQMVF
jgi:hypothetical protein